MHSYDVRIWSVRQRKDRGQTSAELRWKTGETPHSQTFRTKTLADGRRAELLRAVHAGEPFDEATGFPLSELRQRDDVSWYQHARDYIEMKWKHSPGSTRRTLAEAMATVTPALVKDTKGMADVETVRTALYSWAFNVSRRDQEPPDDVAKVLTWFERKSLPTSALADRMQVRAALDALTKKLDGGTAAASTIRRKRAIFHNALGYAVDAGRLSDNPFLKSSGKRLNKWKRSWTPPLCPILARLSRCSMACARRAPGGAAWWRSSDACTTRRHGRPRSSDSACRTASYPGAVGAPSIYGRPAPGRDPRGPIAERLTTNAGSSIAPARRSGPFRSRPTWLLCCAGTPWHTAWRRTAGCSALSAGD